MTNTQLIIAISVFFFTAVGGKLVDRFFAKKHTQEDSIEKDIKENVEKVLSKLSELDNKLSVTNERTEMLFKMVNKHEEKIEKLTDEILEIHKKEK